MQRLLAFLFLTSSAVAQLPTAKPVPRMQAVPLPHHVTSFQLDGRELTAFHFDPSDRRPFCYPIRTGLEPSLTRMGHPHDPHGHSHHNSVWMSHHDVNGLDFWGDHAAQQGTIRLVAVDREGYEESDEAASMRVTNHWLRVEDEALQMIEVRRMEVRPLDGAASWLLIVDAEFRAPPDHPVEMGATAFGLMAVRMARSIGVHDGGGRILNSAGQINETQVFRQPATWCDYSGRLTQDEKGFAGISLMNHPINPQNPTPFHVRDDGWMGACLNLDAPLRLLPEAPLRLRYGLWVHEGVPDRQTCEARWREFTELPLADLSDPKKK